jgi:GH24 family phage-related lysozyme (muramidase)
MSYSITRDGLLFMARREALVLVAYKDGKYNAIGLGHNGPEVKNDDTITPKAAFTLFREDVLLREIEVWKLLRATVSQPTYDMLISMRYQSGNRYVPAIIGLLNDGHKIEDETVQKLWLAGDKNQAGTYMKGLAKRRRLEYLVAHTGQYEPIDPETGIKETINPIPFFKTNPHAKGAKMEWYTVTEEDLPR